MRSDYERVTYINWWKNLFLIVSTLVTISLSLVEKYKLLAKYKDLADYVDLIIAFNSLIIVLYIVLEIRGNFVYSKAEKQRRLQYLDNSFNTSFAGHRVQNYFSQDHLTPGFYKLAVNCFENTYTTFNIVRHMQLATYRNAIIVGLVFIFSASVGDRGLIRTLLEAILPLALIQEAIKTALFINRLETLLDNFKTLFTTLRNSDFTNREPEAMKQVIDYETTLAWASLPLNSKVFNKHRIGLASEWEELKQEYNIRTT